MIPFRNDLLLWMTKLAILGVSPHPSHESPAVPSPNHAWQLENGDNWQIVGAPTETPDATDAREGTRGQCLVGMVEVQGTMKVATGWKSINDQQSATCLKWMDKRYPGRCVQFDKTAWQAAARHLHTRRMQFCIDRFEYPNGFGAYPIVDVTWYEASAICQSEQKRLCSEREWTFACEGEQATPYPTGYERNSSESVIDRPWHAIDYAALGERTTARAEREIDRLWEGEASGSRPEDKSSFGVYDLIGNVDEWTSSVDPHERPSVLKGGYWGPVRTRCRPATRAHGPSYSNYQQGFRCCRDAP